MKNRIGVWFVFLLSVLFGATLGVCAQEHETLGNLLRAYNESAMESNQHYLERRAKLDLEYISTLEKLLEDFEGLDDPVSGAKVQASLDAHRRDRNGSLESVRGTPEGLKEAKEKLLRSRRILLAMGKSESAHLMNKISGKLERLKAAYEAKEMSRSVKGTQEVLDILFEDPLYLEGKSKGEGLAAKKGKSVGEKRSLAKLDKALLEVKVFKKNKSRVVAVGDEYDNKHQKLVFTIAVKSREVMVNHKNLNVHLWAFGRAIKNKREYKILVEEEYSIDELLRGKKSVHITEMFLNIYDDDFNYYWDDRFGHKFLGYVVDVMDEDGEVLTTYTSPSNMLKNKDVIKSQGRGGFFHL